MGGAADFPGDEGDTGAGFTGARGFDGGVEREDVRPNRDLVDDLDDLPDVAAGIVEGDPAAFIASL